MGGSQGIGPGVQQMECCVWERKEADVAMFSQTPPFPSPPKSPKTKLPTFSSNQIGGKRNMLHFCLRVGVGCICQN